MLIQQVIDLVERFRKNKKLTDILTGIANINFEKFENNDIDASVDAYEYLISNYASNVGKYGGEFFTPQTVSKLLAMLVMDGKKNINKVYEKTCGFRVIIMTLENSNSGYIVLESIKKNKRICFL